MEKKLTKFSGGIEMKVLLVDDELPKIREIMKVIMEVDGISDSMIDYSVETNDAREKLQNSIYDLLILDLNMPERLVEDNDEDAGAALVDELIGVMSYKKPTEIVVLSAYDECENNFMKERYRNAFIMLRYDETSLVWSTKLKAIVEYRLLYSLQMQEHEMIDVAIISTVPVETEAVKKLCASWNKESFSDDVNTYYVGTLSEGEKSKKVVTVQSTDMGMVAAALTTLNLSKHYKPRYIIIVGIAAGVGEHEFGDILIPREIWNYSSGKYCGKDDNLIFKPDPKVIQLNAKILELIRQDYSEVLLKIKKMWPEKMNGEINICDSPMACGTAVVANRKLVEDHIIAHFRKSGGLDMETYGVFFAARSMCDSQPIAICIKSVSDFADDNKGDGYQPYAAYTSANFAKHLILNVLK